MFERKDISVVGIICLMAATIVATGVPTTPIRECETRRGLLPLMVLLNDCHELPCSMHKNMQSNLTVQFVATKNSMSQMHTEICLSTWMSKTQVQLEESQQDVCMNLMFGAMCPMDAEEDATVHVTFAPGHQQPEAKSKLEVSIVDLTNASTVACFITDVRVLK